MTKQERNERVAELATLEKRLDKGIAMSGDDVDRLFLKLLRRYEMVYDELRAAGHV